MKIKSDSQDEDSPSGLVPAAYVEQVSFSMPFTAQYLKGAVVQAEHTSFAKALYDYDATAPGELSIREDEILMIFDREDEWILVQSQKEGGKAGFVPGNYVQEVCFHLASGNAYASLSKSSGEEQVTEPEPEPELEPEPEPAPRPQLVRPSVSSIL